MEVHREAREFVPDAHGRGRGGSGGLLRSVLRFEETFATDWYVSLRHVQRPESELAFLHADHQTVPSGFGTPSRGVLINFEVDDAAGEYERLVQTAGLEPVLPLRDEAFGQRHSF
jgi:hypothetical protein